jgi:uridine phosphorylase
MNKLRDTELIITNSGRIYHLNLKKEEIADDIILVGDPNRVEQISNKFEKIDFKITHREFITHTGYYNNKKISVISSGIGTDNIDIVINELDALANINFETRQINKIKRSLNIIRLGTSGGLNKKIDVDSFLVSEYAIGLDGLAHFYKNNDVLDQKLSKMFFNKTNWSKNHASPYSVKASDKLLNKFNNFSKGITLTATGFYGPQCRNMRLKSSISDLENLIESIEYQGLNITNFEMETSALYFLGRSLGHNTLTICAILANRISKKYSTNPIDTIDELINEVLKNL